MNKYKTNSTIFTYEEMKHDVYSMGCLKFELILDPSASPGPLKPAPRSSPPLPASLIEKLKAKSCTQPRSCSAHQ